MVRRDDGKLAALARRLTAERGQEALARLSEDDDGLRVLARRLNERGEVGSLGVAENAFRVASTLVALESL